MKKTNKLKNVKGYKNAEDILPYCGDGVSMHEQISELGFYVQGVSITGVKPPIKITPHHKFEPVDCNNFRAVSFSIRTFWDCDTPKTPNPNRIVIIYDKGESEGYEIPAKFVDWTKVQKWKPTFKMIDDK